MTTEQKNIDKLFRKGLDDTVKAPPPYVWDKINTTLSNQFSARRKLFWLSQSPK